MERLGSPGGGLVAAISKHALRVVGVVTLALSMGVASLSVTTTDGLAVEGSGAEQSATLAADIGLLPALVEFGAAHPAYPAAAAFGLVLLVLGDEVPLLGS